MRTSRILLLAGLMCLSMPLAAAADQTGLVLRYGVGYVFPSGDAEVDFLGSPATFEYESRIAFSLGCEYKFSSWFGLDSTLLYSNTDVDVEGRGLDEGGEGMFMPLFLGVNFHLTPNKKADFFVGPMAAYVIYDNVEFDDVVENIRSGFGYGANIGVGLPLIEDAWVFDAEVKYVATKAKSDEPDGSDVDVNPWIIQLSAGYRF